MMYIDLQNIKQETGSKISSLPVAVNRRKEKYETINTGHSFFINPISMDIFINFIIERK